jgi:retinol-binding protein 3
MIRSATATLFLLFATLSTVATASAGDSEFVWPKTAAGKAAQAFFAMLADGSDQAARAFETTYRTATALRTTPIEERVRRAQQLRQRFGSLSPQKTAKNSPELLVIAAVSADGGAVDVEFRMDAKEPGKLESIGIAVEGPANAGPALAIDAAGKAALVEAVAAAVARTYVYPEIGEAMAMRVRSALASGDYQAISTERAMASRLTADLRAVSPDKHLAVLLDPTTNPSDPAAHHIMDMGFDNFAFQKLEILDGNIGYLRLDMFMDDPEALRTADAAMAFLAHSGAIIIDLRHNVGGSPEMIRHLTSYFFDAPTHLNSMRDRNGAVVSEYWTQGVAGKKFRPDLPLYVLTSSFSFSGAEEFAYNLKSLRRATIVGETTGGGAHPVRFERVDDRFVAAIPYERAWNPITKTNWEGVGVEPDIKTSAAEALDKALELARAASPRR